MSGDQIRLSDGERKTLRILTGVCPGRIKTRTQLRAFVEAHLAFYQGSSPQERLLCRLLEQFLPDE